ncbi:MAG: lipoyl(octanoyl) transferase LipB [Armatimonadetes bacterium]|nr:lipoyl(octanoyl) transferase LipB [Armatimonadota bacterium]
MRDAWLLEFTRKVTPYAEAWDLQKRLVEARQQERIGDGLILLEHAPVFTLGRSSRPEHLPYPRETLTELGFSVYEIERGGSVTYHGPGQLVGYPILDLRSYNEDIVKYMRSLEETLIRTLADFGINAQRLRGFPGVWVADEKIAAIGVAVKRKVTMHGFALNVAPDLAHFAYINPCGLNKPVTSMTKVLGRPVSMSEVREAYARSFGEVYGLSLSPASADALRPFDSLRSLRAFDLVGRRP